MQPQREKKMKIVLASVGVYVLFVPEVMVCNGLLHVGLLL